MHSHKSLDNYVEIHRMNELSTITLIEYTTNACKKNVNIKGHATGEKLFTRFDVILLLPVCVAGARSHGML